MADSDTDGRRGGRRGANGPLPSPFRGDDAGPTAQVDVKESLFEPECPLALGLGEDLENLFCGPPHIPAVGPCRPAPPLSASGANLPALLQASALQQSLGSLAGNAQPPLGDCDVLCADGCATLEELSNNWQLTPAKPSFVRDREEETSPPFLPCTAGAPRPSCSPPAKLAQRPPGIAYSPALVPASGEQVQADVGGAGAPPFQMARPGGGGTPAGGGVRPPLPQQQPQKPQHQHSVPARGARRALAVAAAAAGSQAPTIRGRGPPPGAPVLPRAPVLPPEPAPAAAADPPPPPGAAQPGSTDSASSGGDGGGCRGLSIEYLESGGFFDMPLQRAAAELRVGVTSLKKLCRQHNIDRWPYRKRSSLDRLIAKTRDYFAADPQQCAQALAKLEAERASLRGNVGNEVTEQVKRYRQSIFKMEFKVRRLAGNEEQRAGGEGSALSQVCANGRKCSIRHLAGPASTLAAAGVEAGQHAPLP